FAARAAVFGGAGAAGGGLGGALRGLPGGAGERDDGAVAAAAGGAGGAGALAFFDFGRREAAYLDCFAVGRDFDVQLDGQLHRGGAGAGSAGRVGGDCLAALGQRQVGVSAGRGGVGGVSAIVAGHIARNVAGCVA